MFTHRATMVSVKEGEFSMTMATLLCWVLSLTLALALGPEVADQHARIRYI